MTNLEKANSIRGSEQYKIKALIKLHNNPKGLTKWIREKLILANVQLEADNEKQKVDWAEFEKREQFI